MSVRWVVALKEEAKIILDYYKMILVPQKTLYPIYTNKEETHFCAFDDLYSGTNPEEAEQSACSFMK